MATASGRLIAWLKRGKIQFFIFSFICVATILVKGRRLSEQELAKYRDYVIDNDLGYLVGGFLLIWQISVAGRRATAAEKTAELTERGNIAERFKNAIEHLGNGSASVHLGGVYALHHIAQEVEDYRKRVFEILCAHIRETTTDTEYKPRNADRKEIKPTIEVQSILNLLFNKTQDHKIYKGLWCNLEGADLRGARFENANLQNADLTEAHLQDARLFKVNLQDARLFKVNLQDADLTRANLQDARLFKVNLQDADLTRANLQGARLYNVDLQDTILHDANLQKTSLVYTKNLKVEQLLRTENLYKAKLPKGMDEEIKKKKPELFEPPKPKQKS